MNEHKPDYDSTVMHLRPFIKPTDAKKIVDKCIAVLSHLEFDTIAFRGLSGALLAPTIAMQMGKELIAVRKGEECHSHRTVEGNCATLLYVIVDDFVSSGATVRAILHEIHKEAPQAKCIGVLEADRLTDVYTWELVPSNRNMDYTIVRCWEKENQRLEEANYLRNRTSLSIGCRPYRLQCTKISLKPQRGPSETI